MTDTEKIALLTAQLEEAVKALERVRNLYNQDSDGWTVSEAWDQARGIASEGVATISSPHLLAVSRAKDAVINRV